ncbi:MAG: 4-hydroxy-tetrahydrodipicolinate synthase [bacterium]|nr:4-hydroxy-tetrahydrodipicolinate synthase [bacterium]
MYRNQTFSGIYPAIITPFSKDGTSICWESLERLLKYQVKSKVDGVVVCGSTGEAQTLSDQEFYNIIESVLKFKSKDFKVIAGVGSNDTKKACQLARWCKESGTDAILLVTPFYNKPTQAGLVAHVDQVKQQADIPIIAYNVPGRTGVNLLPQTVAKMVEMNLIVGIKEASGSMDQILDIISLVGDKVAVLAGDESLLCCTLVSGGHGGISATGNLIPELLVSIMNAAKDNDWETARKVQLEALPLIRACFMETNPIPLKAAMNLKGIIQHDTLRLPLTSPQEVTRERFRTLLDL